jgi:hypothetical protein
MYLFLDLLLIKLQNLFYFNHHSAIDYCWQAAIDTQKPPEAISGNMTTGT